MHDCVNAFLAEKLVKGIPVKKISFYKPPPLNRLMVARGKVVKHGNFMMLGGKHLCHVGTDVAGATAYQYIHSFKEEADC
jgi:hypothetical protein